MVAGSKLSPVALWALMAIYAAARVLQGVPDKVPIVLIVGLHVLPPLLFAMLHGALRYRLRGILVFAALSLFIGNLTENLGVVTGFPFGHYRFLDALGPKLFNVPVLLGLAYVGMGYLSWTLGLIILGDDADWRPRGSRLVTRPLIASFIMVAWDLSMDPTWSNLVHGWVWTDGGSYYGVPVSNFFGWYVTNYLIFQSFALYLRGRQETARDMPPGYWHMAVMFYGLSAAGNLFVLLPQGGPEITDAAGTHWQAAAIVGASAIISIFVMGAFTLMAWVRLTDQVST